MPGLDGLDLAQVLARFADRPQVVFVTAYDEHAVDAFELQATDYVMKPVRAERLAEAVRRVVAKRSEVSPSTTPPEDETIPVELGGVTRFIQRSQILYARRTATTRGCTPRTAHTSSASRSTPSRSVGRKRDSSASTAPRWCRSRT